jgi:hypothetical protein
MIDPGPRLPALLDLARTQLAASVRFTPPGSVDVFDALTGAYGRALLAWVGLEPESRGAALSAPVLADIADGHGGGSAPGRSLAARLQALWWATGVVADVRAGRRPAAAGTLLADLADGDRSDARAGALLVASLRPVLALAWMGTFAAARLAEHPHWRGRLKADGRVLTGFAREVRRTTPHVPALVAGDDSFMARLVGDRVDEDTDFDPSSRLDESGWTAGDAGEAMAVGLLEVTLDVLARVRTPEALPVLLAAAATRGR